MIREIQPGEGAIVAAVLHELRPHVAIEDVPARVDEQRGDGYRVVAAFDGERAVGAIGFRPGTNLALGPFVYVDDLVVLPDARGAGHARALLDWVSDEAKRLGCSYLHLDSNTSRLEAHRLYLNNGYDITAFHFTRSI